MVHKTLLKVPTFHCPYTHCTAQEEEENFQLKEEEEEENLSINWGTIGGGGRQLAADRSRNKVSSTTRRTRK